MKAFYNISLIVQMIGFIIALVALMSNKLDVFFWVNGFVVILSVITMQVIKYNRKRAYNKIWENRLN